MILFLKSLFTSCAFYAFLRLLCVRRNIMYVTLPVGVININGWLMRLINFRIKALSTLGLCTYLNEVKHISPALLVLCDK